MMIAGYVPNSFVDYPGKIAMVIFSPGCNMNCWYCHNRHLIRTSDSGILYNETAILAELEKKKDFLDAVVLSGGEPMLQTGLLDFAKAVKALGYLVKLDTNGTDPKKLRIVIDDGLVDYVAIDIKAPFSKYADICGRNISIDDIRESIDILILSNIDYEFRTTFSPDLDKEDLLEIAKSIHGAKRFALQQYRMPEHMMLEHTIGREPHSPSYVRECADAVAGRFAELRVLGL